MTTLFIVFGCIAGFNALYLFFYVMDDIISQIRKIGKPKKQTTDFTFLDDLDESEDAPEKPETYEIYDISSLTEDDDSMPELSPDALKTLRSYDVRRFIKEEMYWLNDYILDELSRFEMESLTLLFSSYIKHLIRTGQEEDKTFSTLREMLDSSDPYTTMEEADTVEEMIRSTIRHMPIKPDYYGEYLTYKATCENRPKVLESAKRILVAIDVNFDVFGMHKKEKKETTDHAERV